MNTEKMQALVIDPPGNIQLKSMPMPVPWTGESLVMVHMVGICRTDREFLNGYQNYVGTPGHEFVGTVVEGDERLKGKRVVGDIHMGCGQCVMCLKGLERHCPERKVLGIRHKAGAMAEFLTMPSNKLLPLPDAIKDEEAIFAEPLAAVLDIFEQVHFPPVSKVLIIGDGPIGLLTAQYCTHIGLRVTMIGRYEMKLRLARGWGVETICIGDGVVSNGEPPPVKKRFPFVIECSGSTFGLDLALLWTAPRGTLVIKSFYNNKPKPVPGSGQGQSPRASDILPAQKTGTGVNFSRRPPSVMGTGIVKRKGSPTIVVDPHMAGSMLGGGPGMSAAKFTKHDDFADIGLPPLPNDVQQFSQEAQPGSSSSSSIPALPLALPPQIDLTRIVTDELRVIGSRCGPFGAALRLLAEGKIDVRCLIEHRKKLNQGVEAFRLANDKGTLKVVIAMD